MHIRRMIFGWGCFCLLLVAATAAQEKVGSSVQLEGQVVCSVCWFEADRSVTPYGNEGDLECAEKCAKAGKQLALAVNGPAETKLYIIEPSSLGKKSKSLRSLVGKHVKANGIVRESADKLYVTIESVQVVKPEKAKQDPERSSSGKPPFKVIVTDEGYEPATITLERGVPARITFVRQSDASCGTEIVIAEYGIKKELPLNKPVTVELTPKKSGEFGFSCGMDMLKGKIVVN